LTMHRGHRAPPRSAMPHTQDFAMQRDRLGRFATITAHDRIVEPSVTASSNGGMNRPNPQLTLNPLAVPRRARGFGQQPIVESPPPSDVASNRSTATNQSNGAGFFRTYQEITSSSQSNGALTPDLNFAEIGHGRGAGSVVIGSSMSVLQQSRRGFETLSGVAGHMVDVPSHGISQMIHASSSQIDFRNGHPMLANPSSATVHPNGGPTGNGSNNNWPHVRQEASSPSPSSSPTRPGIHGSVYHANGRTSVEETDGRGRNVKRSLRNTLNVAEHFATSFLFGRGSTVHEGTNGMGSGMETTTGARGH
jgi:F-box and leucine-rich repeat protein GRR1